MSPAELLWLAPNREVILGAITALTVTGAGGAAGLIMHYGGIQRVERHLQVACDGAARDARSKVKRGLAIRDGDDVHEEGCVDALIAGLDEWRQHRSNRLYRRACFQRASLSVKFMAAAASLTWCARVLNVEYGWIEAGAALAWLAPTLLAAYSAWPIAGELLAHGFPRDVPDPSPGALALPEPTEGVVIAQSEAARGPTDPG